MGEISDQAKGRVKQAAGDLTDDDRLKREGKVDEAGGKVKGAVDDLKDRAEGAVDAVKDKLHGR
ncbi:MAG: CsbD family protein [Acidimicrobiales bacterium]|nr:CsbD family protein [Acidimicrobiales bacterium]